MISKAWTKGKAPHGNCDKPPCNHKPTMRSRAQARWRQGIWTPTDQLIIMVWMLWQATIRGNDYRAGSSGADYQVLEAAFPLWLVGGWFLLGALIVFLGIVLDRHMAVWLGHTLLCVAYFTVTAAVTIEIVKATAWTAPWLAVATLVATFTLLLALRWSTLTSATRRGAMFCVGLVVVALLVLAPEGEALRTPGIFFGGALVHALWAMRTSPDPPDDVVALGRGH